MLAQERETDHVGEPHRDHRALSRCQPVAAQHHAALDSRRHLPAPDEFQQLGHGGNRHVGNAGKRLGGEDRVDLRADHVSRDELRLGDTSHRRTDHAGHLHSCFGVGGPECLEALEQAHRFEVEIRKRAIVLIDPGKAERAPEPLQHVDADAGELGDLDPGVTATRGDEQAVRHEEVDHAIGDGLVDLPLGGPVHQEDLLDVLERRLPARLVVRLGQHVVVVEDPAHVGSPRSSDSSHSGREGRRIRFKSASAGEQRPSTMAWTCSAMGISTP